MDGIVFPIAEAHMHHFTVSYNEGLEGLERAIMEAIEQLVKQNVNPKEIVIYMSPFVNHFIIQAVHDLPFRSAFQINMEKATISQYFAYPVLPGYEYGKVIVSYIQGERVNIPAISISFEVKRTKS